MKRVLQVAINIDHGVVFVIGRRPCVLEREQQGALAGLRGEKRYIRMREKNVFYLSLGE